MMSGISSNTLTGFKEYLELKERSDATIEKYLHEIRMLQVYIDDCELTKNELIAYRLKISKCYQPQTINGKLNAINCFLKYLGLNDMLLNLLRVQHNAFIDESRELTEKEYRRMLQAALDKGNIRLYYLMLTLAGTGIRISELQYITVEAVTNRKAEISMKGKNRVILISKKLQKKLQKYISLLCIDKGQIFCTKHGLPLDRSNVCHEMKQICEVAGVSPHKVFPHNFRHLFARAFYAVEKNIAHLADILGHSNIETTRIYLLSSTRDYEHALCRMNLIIQK